MKTLAAISAAALLAATLAAQSTGQPSAVVKPVVANAAPARTCESLAAVSLRNTTIDSEYA